LPKEEKTDARWEALMEKQEVNICLLKTNVATKKREKDLALLMADTTPMDTETRAWYEEQRAIS
jgi:glycine cleavage system regulatory protein